MFIGGDAPVATDMVLLLGNTRAAVPPFQTRKFTKLTVSTGFKRRCRVLAATSPPGAIRF
jgi:hypothetical protein